MEDGCTHVKVHDLSMDVTDEQLTSHMTQYGEVLSIQELVWTDDYEFAGLPTGIRLIKMFLQQPIKSYISICGESTYVTYPGQRATCKHCGEYMHTGIPCVQNKKLLVQKASVNERLTVSSGNSYASVVKQPPVAPAHANNFDPDVYVISDSEGAKTETNGTMIDTSNPAASQTAVMQTEQMDTISTDTEAQTTELLAPPMQAIYLESTDTAVFRLPIQPGVIHGSLGSKHKRDDGNTTDESSTSSNSKKERKQTKKHYKFLRNTDTGIE